MALEILIPDQLPEPGDIICDEGGCRIVPKKYGSTEDELTQHAKRAADALVTAAESLAQEIESMPQQMEEPVKIGKDRWRARIQLDWLPLPAEALRELGWKEGDEIEISRIMNGQVILRKKDALRDK